MGNDIRQHAGVAGRLLGIGNLGRTVCACAGGVALVSLNGVVNLHLRPLGDLMALGSMVS